MSKRGEAVENSFLSNPLTLIAGNPGRRICLLYGSLNSWLFTGAGSPTCSLPYHLVNTWACSGSLILVRSLFSRSHSFNTAMRWSVWEDYIFTSAHHSHTTLVVQTSQSKNQPKNDGSSSGQAKSPWLGVHEGVLVPICMFKLGYVWQPHTKHTCAWLKN